MTILFLHGWHSVPGGLKPTYLSTAEYACRIASVQSGRMVRKGKEFDDPIESGIAFLTGVS